MASDTPAPSPFPALLRRPSPLMAHIAPLGLFMLLSGLVSVVGVKNPALPWWRSMPEQWVYPLQTVIVGVLLLLWRKQYRLMPWRNLGLASVLGAIGIVAWILPGQLWIYLTDHGVKVADYWKWLGVAPRLEGFDPSFVDHQPLAYGVVLFFRFARMVLVVPLVEEICWRSFLMRYIVAGEERDFTSVPFGTHTWPAFIVTTLAVVLIHQPVDYLGALVFGSLMYWLAVRSKSLGACVVMHAVANLLLGLYVLKTKQWGFW